METQGYKKIIVDLKGKSSNFAILVIEEETKKASLSYYRFVKFRTIEITANDIESFVGWKEWSDEIVKKAEKVCKENDAVLWSY